MENKMIKMTGPCDMDLQELTNLLKRELQSKSASLVSETFRECGGSMDLKYHDAF